MCIYCGLNDYITHFHSESLGLSLTSAGGSFFTMKGKNETCLLNLKLKAGKQGWNMEEFTVSFQREGDNGGKESTLFHFFSR